MACTPAKTPEAPANESANGGDLPVCIAKGVNGVAGAGGRGTEVTGGSNDRTVTFVQALYVF